jgi:precorrin-6A synthase
MFELSLIGIGTGNPDHLTAQGARAIRDADLILIPRKGGDKADLAELRQQIIAEVAGKLARDAAPRISYFDIPKRRAEDGYLQGVDEWHDAIANLWQDCISAADPSPTTVALLIWGDPSLYDSSLRIAALLNPQPKIRVIPGITALQALTAAHCIPVNDIGAPFLVTTGRRLRDQGWPADTDTLAIMLDGQCSFQSLESADYDIWWGAYLGMGEELLISGALAEVSEQILTTRADARAAHGWIMDIYLLKKRT